MVAAVVCSVGAAAVVVVGLEVGSDVTGLGVGRELGLCVTGCADGRRVGLEEAGSVVAVVGSISGSVGSVVAAGAPSQSNAQIAVPAQHSSSVSKRNSSKRGWPAIQLDSYSVPRTQKRSSSRPSMRVAKYHLGGTPASSSGSDVVGGAADVAETVVDPASAVVPSGSHGPRAVQTPSQYRPVPGS